MTEQFSVMGVDKSRSEVMDSLEVSFEQPNALWAELNGFSSGGAYYGMAGVLYRLANGWALQVMDDGAVECSEWFSDDGRRSVDLSTSEFDRLVAS